MPLPAERRASALQPVSSNAQAVQKAVTGATRIPKPAKPSADGPEGLERPCAMCERSDSVLREAQNTIKEQEEELKFLTDKAEELCVALANAQEESAQYQAEAERIQAEGQELYVSYTAKCGKVVQLTAQHAQLTGALAERDQRLSELERTHAAERAALNEQLASLQASALSAAGGPADAVAAIRTAGETRQAHLREAAEMSNELLRDELRQTNLECDRLRAELNALAAGAAGAAGNESAREGEAAARAELSRAHKELAAAQKEVSALSRELAGAMVSNERLQDDLRTLRKSRGRESFTSTATVPAVGVATAARLPAATGVDAWTQPEEEAVALVPGVLSDGSTNPTTPSVDAESGPEANGQEQAGAATALGGSADIHATTTDDHATADLIAELETELEEQRKAAQASEARAALAEEARAAAAAEAAAAVAALESELARASTRAEADAQVAPAPDDGAGAAEAAAAASAAAEAAAQAAIASAAAMDERHAALAAEQQHQLEAATEALAAAEGARMEAEARLEAALAEVERMRASAEEAGKSIATAHEASASAQADAARAREQLREVRAALGAAAEAELALAERADAAEARADSLEVLGAVQALAAATEARELTAAAEQARSELALAREAEEAARSEGRVAIARLSAEVARWRSEAEELTEYAALEAETASLSRAEALAVEEAVCSARAAGTSLVELEMEVSDLAINAADMLEQLGAAERYSVLRCAELEATLAEASAQQRQAEEAASLHAADVDAARADAADARARAADAARALEAAHAAANMERAEAEKALADAGALADERAADLGERLLAAQTELEAELARVAELEARAAERERAVAEAAEGARALLAKAREEAEADARAARAQADVREMVLGDSLAAADDVRRAVPPSSRVRLAPSSALSALCPRLHACEGRPVRVLMRALQNILRPCTRAPRRTSPTRSPTRRVNGSGCAPSRPRSSPARARTSFSWRRCVPRSVAWQAGVCAGGRHVACCLPVEGCCLAPECGRRCYAHLRLFLALR